MKKITLAGVPNCGKTTFWNISTGLKAKTGNWPGVTAEKLSGTLRLYPDAELIDLPGIYSLSGNSLEEKVAEDFLKTEKTDSIILIIDGTKPEQGLFLALQILSLKTPTVVGINFSDEMKRKNISVDTEGIENALGTPVFLICAPSGENTDVLIKKAYSLKQKSCRCFPSDEHRKTAELLAKEFFCFGKSKKSSFPNIKKLFSFFIPTVFAFAFSLMLNFCIPIFSEHFSAFVSLILGFIKTPESVILLFTEGIIPGITAVFSFFPQMFFLFLSLSILEDSGYMARIAFFSDRVLRNFGFSGRSVISMLIGFGCSVPAIYSIKSSKDETEKENLLSALMFIPCSARLPLAVFICSSVFGDFGKYSVFIFYSFVTATGLCFSFFYNRKHKSSFILELPEIRFPSIKSVFKAGFVRFYGFASKAFISVVLASVLIWVLKNYTFSLSLPDFKTESMLFDLAKFFEPFFVPTGIPFEGIIALFCGLFSKESSLFVLLSFSEKIGTVFNPLSAISFLLFYFIYSPCLAALSSIKAEFGIKKAARLFIRQTALAYFISFSFYQISVLIKNLFIP